MSTENTVLEFTAKGYVVNPELYGRVFKSFIETNKDESGNIIDDTEQQQQVQALRKAMAEMGRLDLVELIEKIVMYENYGGDDRLMEFLDITKRFVVAVEKEPNKLEQYYPHWEKHTLNIKDTGVAALTKANLIRYTLDYIEGVIKR